MTREEFKESLVGAVIEGIEEDVTNVVIKTNRGDIDVWVTASGSIDGYVELDFNVDFLRKEKKNG